MYEIDCICLGGTKGTLHTPILNYESISMTPSLSAAPDQVKLRAMRGRCVRAAVAALFTLTLLRLLAFGPSVELVVGMQSYAGSDGEIFYAMLGQEYAPDRRIKFVINTDGQWHTYRIPIPEHGGLSRVRVDPGSASGIIGINQIAVATPGHLVVLVDDQLIAAVGVTNDLRVEPGVGQNNLRFTARAQDPFVDFKLPDGTGVLSTGVQSLYWLTSGIAAALLWLLLVEFAWPMFARRFSRFLKIPRVFHRLAPCVSDSEVLIVAPPALLLVIMTLLGAVLYVALNLNQSSIGVWEEMYPAKAVAQLVDIGTAKHIRSDEWNTQTPWVLNQVARGEKDHNPSIGGEEAPLLAALPTMHSWAIAQGEFYGFHLFDSATGFSWWWGYKSFGLLLSFFWLFLILTRGNVAASVLGTVWVYGSSFVQWWFSSNMIELLIAFALATIGSVYLLFAHRRIMVALGAALLAYSVLNVLLHLYPPFIVPLAYLGIAILVGVLLEPGSAARINRRLRWRVLCLIGTILVVSLIGGSYLIDAMPSIKVMASTVYPGHRVSEGGGFPWERLLYGFFEVFRMDEQQLPLPPTNASEASSFIILAPLLLLVMPLVAFARRENGLLIALTLYCLVLVLWISVPLPRIVESAMQVVGWSWSSPPRSVLGLGLASVIAVTILFSRIREGTIELRSSAVRWMVSIFVLSCLLLFGALLHRIDPTFFSFEKILMASVVAATITAGVVFGRAGLFAAGLAIAVAPAVMVNPLVSGLSAISEKPILLAAKRQGDAVGDRWAVVGAFVFSQGLKAQGLEVVTGSQLIPNRKMARLLDPQGKYENVWNRYAHVVLRSDPGRVRAVYELRTPDMYVIGVDICGPALSGLGVTRIAYTDAVPTGDLKCLVPLEAPPDSGVRLFRLSSRTAAASP